ncbi:MAG: lysostaphin resistance A-like protein [Actinomycetota bacterium]
MEGAEGGSGVTDDIPPRPDGLWPAEEPPVEASPRPLATWRWWEAVSVYLIGLLVVGLVALPLFQLVEPPGLARWVATVVQFLLLLGVLLWWLNRFHPRWKEIVGFPSRLWPEIRAGIGFGLLLYPVLAFGVGLLLNLLFEAVSGRTVRVPEQVPGNIDGLSLAFIATYALAVAPAGEEIFFRGCLFRALRDRYGFAPGAAGSSIAFALIHYIPGPWLDSVFLMTVMVFTGLGFALLYERRGNIVANLVAHSTFNLVGLTLILLQR